MQQWIAEVVYDSSKGPKKVTESYYMPSVEDVRLEIVKNGGYVLSIRAHERSSIERLLARSSWWQVQLLRGIQFRSTATSPGVALWRIIQAETNPMRQNILAPAREALSKGLGIIDALKSLKIFDHSTIAILAASERANKIQDGIPHAIHSITQKRKNTRAIAATMSWLAIDVVMIVQSLFWGKGMILEWFRGNAPTDPEKLDEYLKTVNGLELTWDILIGISFICGAFLGWTVFSYWVNKGKTDWPTARIVRKIPLIGAYLRDLGFADSMMAAARMLRGLVPIDDALRQSAEATTVPDVSAYWNNATTELERGVMLGAALDREPLTRNERLEVASLSDLTQVATVLESIAEMRSQAAKTKHSLIVWAAFGLTGVFLAIAFGSAIYALTVMNLSLDNMMGGLMQGAI